MNRQALYFTEGPCDDELPDVLKHMLVQASMRARRQAGDERLDRLRTRLFMELSKALSKPDREWTAAEDDALLALVDEVLVRLCTGALLHSDEHEPRGFKRATTLPN